MFMSLIVQQKHTHNLEQSGQIVIRVTFICVPESVSFLACFTLGTGQGVPAGATLFLEGQRHGCLPK